MNRPDITSSLALAFAGPPLALIPAGIALAILVSCGGGTTTPLAQCNGTPKAAIVYVGDDVPAALAAVPDACVYTTAPGAGVDAVVDRALSESGKPRVYMIGRSNAGPLDFMAARPGYVDTASLWFAPAWSGDLRGSLVAIIANGGHCPVAVNHYGPVQCLPAVSGFDLATAIDQLRLDLIP